MATGIFLLPNLGVSPQVPGDLCPLDVETPVGQTLLDFAFDHFGGGEDYGFWGDRPSPSREAFHERSPNCNYPLGRCAYEALGSKGKVVNPRVDLCGFVCPVQIVKQVVKVGSRPIDALDTICQDRDLNNFRAGVGPVPF